jgi:phage tail-like protein
MPAARTSSIVAHPAQWLHCAHDRTALLPSGGVQLTWEDASATDKGSPPRSARSCGEPGGLAFDPWCVGYRADPATGAVVALPPGVTSVSACPGVYRRPRGLAVDGARRLYVTDPGAHEVVVLDLEQRRVLRRIGLGPGRPVDAVAHCGRVLVLTVGPAALFWLEGRRSPRPGPKLITPRCPPGLQPTRIASGPLVLWSAPGRSAVARIDGTVELELGPATDLDVSPDGVLVVARLPGMSFQRFRPEANGWVELEPVAAPGHNGGAIAHTPAGRTIFTTRTGTGTTTGTQSKHASEGSVTSYRLDSGSYRTRWGRIFLDACLPPRTSVMVRFLSSDTDIVLDPIEPALPDRPLLLGESSGRTTVSADAYPPLPSALALEADPPLSAVFRRPNGPEYGWQAAEQDAYQTYEAPVYAPPGRYLWFQLHLQGTDQITPRVRAVRVERPGHQLLNSLPLAWSRADDDADFLQRYLAPAEGLLHELDWRSAQRAVLLNPAATPADKLDWLASFAGLVLDQRWSETARRTLVAEAYPLFARRGTKAALLRLLAIYLGPGRAPQLIEQWQFRGLGGTVLDLEREGPVAPKIGGSARETGTLGRFIVGGLQPDSDSYREAAHRCIVLVPGTLTDEQRGVVKDLLEVHRPAHVSIRLCELGNGMRVGVQLRVALSSFVGPGARWQSAVLGESDLGVDRVVGSGAGAVGVRVGDARMGTRRVR